jgi:cell division protein FtsW
LVCLPVGAKRWISIAGFNFQPSELAKLGLIIFFASLLTDIKEKDKIRNFGWGLIIPLVFLVPVIIAVYVLQNHFSATFIICSVTVVQMLIAGTRLSHFVVLGVAGACGLGVLLNVKNNGSSSGSFRMTRIQTWLNPWSDVTGDGWQIIQSLYAIGSGGLFGAGLGQSKQKYLYLPEPQNDFIFAVLAEELGYVGCLVVIALFLVFIWRGIVISMRAKDTFGSLIAIGITTLIGLQAIINIAVVTNTMPVTGMELPFFSYGGTALMINLFAVGILLNISRSGIKK